MARKHVPPSPWLRLRTLAATRAGRWLLRGLGVAIVLLLAGTVVRKARAYAYRLPAYRIGPASVRFVGLDPAWGPLVERSLRDPRWLRIGTSVFDAHVEERVRDVVARHPMVAAVRGVDVRYPASVDVRVVLRLPAAWFRTRGPDGKVGYLLLSSDSHLLDARLYAHFLRRLRIPLPKVVGVRAGPPDLAGQSWEDSREQVAEALAAAGISARLYRDLRGRIQVETIDVSRFPAPPGRRRDGELRLILRDGTVVEWGRTERDLEGVAGEDGYATKLARLEILLGRRRSRRGGRLDVRFRLPEEARTAAFAR